MAAIIDTCSFIACARYFTPFDDKGTFSAFVEEQIREGIFVLLDKVSVECQRLGQGIATKTFPFLGESNLKTRTDDLQIPKKLFTMIDNNFKNNEICKVLDNAEYQSERERFLTSADFAIIAYTYIHKSEDIIVITEESERANDGKPFKKIPAICGFLGIKVMPITDYLLKDNGFRMTIDYDSAKLFR